MASFRIRFNGGEQIWFKDIIDLNPDQKSKINAYAKKITQDELKLRKSGLKIEINRHQRRTVLQNKNHLTHDKSETELYNDETIIFEGHAIDRIIKRIGEPTISIYTALISDIKHADTVHEKAEWKGYPRLSYTLMREDKSVTLTFLRNGNTIKLVTVSGFGRDSMDFRISEDQKSLHDLLELKRRLKNRYK